MHTKLGNLNKEAFSSSLERQSNNAYFKVLYEAVQLRILCIPRKIFATFDILNESEKYASFAPNGSMPKMKNVF